MNAYESIYQSFGLPPQEAASVVSELVSHTGLISVVGDNQYEFAHLSLQEYLCATYLVRSSYISKLDKYIAEYPQPLAVAVAISSEPGIWLGNLIFDDKVCRSLRPEGLRSMLARLVIERPQFGVSKVLGYALLKLFYSFPSARNPELYHELLRVIQLDGMLESAALALRDYAIGPRSIAEENVFLFYRNDKIAPDCPFPKPKIGALPRNYVRLLAQKFACLYWEVQPGHSIPLSTQSLEWHSLWAIDADEDPQ